MRDSQSDSKRRFERIQIDESHVDQAKVFLAAKAEWSAGMESQIVDMSYTGLALTNPKGLELSLDQGQTLKLHLGDLEPFDISVTVMWKNESICGVSLNFMSGDGRLTYNRFLEDKILGSELHAVDRKLFSTEMDCTHWYQGVGDTNVFLWIDGEGDDQVVQSALVELDDYHLLYRDGKVAEVGGGVSEGGFHSKYGEITSEVIVKDLALREKEFIGRVVSLLSQIQEFKKPMVDVLQNLAKLEL